ncbi:unnamed protein product [Enterobius vermicularis]|uniref:Putative exosome complex component RRP41 n=1 Tax=Enterobius vermicularis TaxID=51028 RepID=A0A0N4VAY6_ENTVE|nr:unnamed protein product [Enterobius vermicularis]
MSASIANLTQLKEFFTVYNTLTERCFNSCVREFNHHHLVESETDCVWRCIDKLMLVNQRLMFIFAEVAPNTIFKQNKDSDLPNLPDSSTSTLADVMNIISEHGFRRDGRKPDQIRNINYKLGVYSQADGSAYLEVGSTKVLCAVYGPHECRHHGRMNEDKCLISCQYSMATFSTNDRKDRPRGDRKAIEFARLMENAFESAILTENYPRSQIDIFCELLQADGSHLAACVNAATLALVDAGIPMRGLVVAASTACDVGGVPCVDVNSREETRVAPRLTIATISGKNEIVLTELQNRLHRDHFLTLLRAARDATSLVHACLETAVSTHVSQALGVSPLVE